MATTGDRPARRAWGARVAGLVLVAGLVGLTVWAGLAPTSAAGWAVVAGVVALLVGWNALARRAPGPRPLRLTLGLAPVVATVVWALAPSFVDQRVDEGLLEAVPVAEPAAATGTAPPAAGAPAPPPRPAEPTRLATGTLEDAGGHSAEGTASLYEHEGTTFVRLDDIDIDNGPDVVVLLVSEPGAASPAGGVELGALKGNQGSASYAVPAGVDVSGLRGVLIWCRAFSTPMATAALA